MRSYSGFFKSQICSASSLVVSKTQRLLAGEIFQLELELRMLNDSAMILTKDWMELSKEEFLVLVDKKTVLVEKTIAHSQSHDFDSMGLRTSKILERKQLESILEKCKNGVFGKILRGKGFIKSKDTFLEFQYVDGNYTISPSKDVAIGVVSFIGSSLQKEILNAVFQ